jgi:U32 family peptidase
VAVLTAQFAKCGDTPFALRSLTAPGFPAVLIPAARFKELRRDFYATLATDLLPRLSARRAQAARQALAALVPAREVTPVRSAHLTLRLEHLRDWPQLHQEGVAEVSFPVSRANLHQLSLMARKLKGRTAQVWWRLPFIIFEADLPWYRQALAELQGAGFSHFMAANLGHLPLIREVGGEFATDYRLFSVNSQALLAWQELGATAATLYIEDDAENLRRLMAADLAIPRRLLVHTAVPLITSKIHIKEVRSDVPVSSDRGDQYQVLEKDGLTVLTAERRFSLSGARGQLLTMGCGGFDIDLTGVRREEWPRIIAAVQSGAELPGTTTFNYLTELV